MPPFGVFFPLFLALFFRFQLFRTLLGIEGFTVLELLPLPFVPLGDGGQKSNHPGIDLAAGTFLLGGHDVALLFGAFGIGIQ